MKKILISLFSFLFFISFILFFPKTVFAASTITISAAGTQADNVFPTMQLLINDQVVQTWQNVQGNPSNRTFQTFTYNSPNQISANQVKVQFTNDIMDQSGDRNLIIDKINIDGTDYQTEAQTTYSTGTWTSGNGCSPGFKQSEWLHCNGYFSFGQSVGSTIKVFAAGTQADNTYPTMQLLINDQVVQTWQNVQGDPNNRNFQTFSYTAQGKVTANQVKVQFSNDISDQTGDRNLRVDKITIDNTDYQTEDPATYSTGTWTSNNGCAPGNKQSEWLHCNGYFAYQAGQSPNQPTPTPTNAPNTIPAGSNGAPTGTITGPTTVTQGNAEYTATINSINNDLTSIEIYEAPKTSDPATSQNWVLIGQGNCTGGSCTLKASWNPPAGQYTVVVNGYNSVSKPCTGNPYFNFSGQSYWSSCGQGSSVVTMVNASSSSGTSYTVSNGKFYQNGNLFQMHGLNWFGTETETHVVHGLWARNYKEMIAQMKSLGFNAVRFPYCPASLHGTAVSSIDYGKNPDLAGLNSQQIMDKVLQEFNDQHMYILLDMHSTECTIQTDHTYYWYTDTYSEAQLTADDQFAAARYKNLPYFMGLDLRNISLGVTWGTGNQASDWNLAAERIGKAVLSVNPNITIFISSQGDNVFCNNQPIDPPWLFWGVVFDGVKCKPIDPSAIPANKVVFTPFAYGIDQFFEWEDHFLGDNFPYNNYPIWDKHWGFLVDSGYTIAITEWGTRYGTDGGHPEDVTLYNALADYLKSKHVCNTFWWAWNANNTPVDGIVQSDWTTPWQPKVDFLNKFWQSCN